MSRIKLVPLVGAVVLLAAIQQSSSAQTGLNGGNGVASPAANVPHQPGYAMAGPAPQRAPVYMGLYPIPFRRGWHGIHTHDYTHYDHVPPAPSTYSHTSQREQYPYLDAPLYPTPQPNIPHQTGGTFITNQAFAPHEMLYPHSYRAMYPPYSYKVQGDWLVTPLGVWSTEHWKLQGTQVSVKYKSRISLLSGFAPPSGRGSLFR